MIDETTEDAMGELSTTVWGRVCTDIPTHQKECEFIDHWTGARHIRELNPDYIEKRVVLQLEWVSATLGFERGWVWRGPPSVPPVIWSQTDD